MSKRDEYIAFIDEFKTISPTITEEQRKGLLRRAVQQHDISVDDADEILKAADLDIGEKVNYFDVLGFSLTDFQNQDESTIASRVDDAHDILYRESLNAGGRVRPDGKTEDQWRVLLNQARDILKDVQKRQIHTAVLQSDVLPNIESSTTSTSDSNEIIPEGESVTRSRNTEAVIDAKLPFRNVLQQINTLLGKTETGLLCLIVATMIGLAVLEIVLRYVFKTSLMWKHMMLQNLTLWMCFLGAALASAERRHISIDALNRILPASVTRFSVYIIDVLSLIVVSILAYYGFVFLIEETKSPATLIGSVPLWWAKTIIPIGFVLIGIHLVLQICINLTDSGHTSEDAEGELN